MRAVAGIVALVIGLASAGEARADTAESAARSHHAEGKRLYEAGQYREAIREFDAGYQAFPRREFLINLGQAYRKLDELSKAREMYLRFLAEAPAADPLRAQVAALIAEIDVAEKAVARPATPATGPPLPTPAEAARAVGTRPSAPFRTREKPTPASSRKAWIFGATGLMVAGVVATILLWPSSPVACSAADLGCVDRR